MVRRIATNHPAQRTSDIRKGSRQNEFAGKEYIIRAHPPPYQHTAQLKERARTRKRDSAEHTDDGRTRRTGAPPTPCDSARSRRFRRDLPGPYSRWSVSAVRCGTYFIPSQIKPELRLGRTAFFIPDSPQRTAAVGLLAHCPSKPVERNRLRERVFYVRGSGVQCLEFAFGRCK